MSGWGVHARPCLRSSVSRTHDITRAPTCRPSSDVAEVAGTTTSAADSPTSSADSMTAATAAELVY